VTLLAFAAERRAAARAAALLLVGARRRRCRLISHPPRTALSSKPTARRKGGNVTSAGWQVTLCDPMWRMSSRSGVTTLRTAIHLLLAYLFTLRRGCCLMMGQTDRRTDTRSFHGLVLCEQCQ